MRTSARKALAALAIAVACAIGYFVWAKTKSPSFVSSLDAIPDGALLVATADVGVLRRSSVMAPLFSEGEVPGIGKVRDVCGFDPLEGITEVAMGIPAAGADGDFGLVASGLVDAESLLSCASKVIEARGGRPVVNPIGGFRTVRDSASRTSSAEIAVRDGGPILLGAGSYLRAMIDAAEGRLPRVSADLLHERLSREIGSGAVRVTVVLTPEQRRTLNEELTRGGAQGSPAASMIGLGLAVSVDARVGLSGVVVCDAAPSCGELGKVFDARRTSQVDDLVVRFVGAAPILERMKISSEGTRVSARVDMSAEEATGLVERLLLLRRALERQEALDSLEDKRPAPAPESSAAPPASASSAAPSAAAPTSASSATPSKKPTP
ncbi:MAG: hypothetical protein IPM54_45280 [Polyangiaceae bacterium]|nr:hypothetical protein [Polyangiaceae bacterium]